MSSCECTRNGREDQESVEVEQLLEEYKGEHGSLIPALQKVQAYYGYLPEDKMKKVAAFFQMPTSTVFGVATFYAQFHLKPRGQYIIRVCQGTACHVRGADKIVKRVSKEIGISPGETTEDLHFTLESVACIGSCGLAPVLMVNDNTHGRLSPDMIPSILDQYKDN